MKIAIITVYKSSNMGGYLQAYALAEAIKRCGHEVFFVDNGSWKTRPNFYDFIKIALKDRSAKKIAFKLRFLIKYKRVLENFAEIKLNNKDLQAYLGVFLGSDEIWNFARPQMSNFPSFFGQGVNNLRIASYAASVNTATQSDLQKFEYIPKSLEKITHISVRDSYTQKVVQSVVPKKQVQLVADPTWLFPHEFYLAKNNIPKSSESYILVYFHEKSLPKNMQDEIVMFAKKHALKIYSAYFWCEFADVNIPANPFEFQEYLSQARYVLTNTFHGTIFSILANKEFLSFTGFKNSKPNRKIIEALDMVGLSELGVKNTDGMDKLVSNNINWSEVNDVILRLRKNSLEYILGVLNDWERDYGNASN